MRKPVDFLGCYDIKSGDRIEYEEVKLFDRHVLIIKAESGLYHSFQIRREHRTDNLLIIQSEDKRFYFREK